MFLQERRARLVKRDLGEQLAFALFAPGTRSARLEAFPAAQSASMH
jgi:hypothetical protein